MANKQQATASHKQTTNDNIDYDNKLYNVFFDENRTGVSRFKRRSVQRVSKLEQQRLAHRRQSYDCILVCYIAGPA